MRRLKGASPWTSPSMERLGNTACSLECLAVFEPCTAGPSGVVTYLASQPRFLVASDRSQVAPATGPFGSSVTSGSLNSNSAEARTSLVPKPLCQFDRRPVTGLFRVLLDRFLLPYHRPRFQSNVRLGIPNRLSIQHIAMYGVTDSCAKTPCSSTVPVRQQVSGVLLLRPPLDDMRSI